MSSDSDSGSSSSGNDGECERSPSVASGSSQSSSEADTDIHESSNAAPKSKDSAPNTTSLSTSSGISESSSKGQSGSTRNATQPGQKTSPSGIDKSQVAEYTWEDLALSDAKSTRLRNQTEPERARNWLKRVLKADSQSELVQATLWHAYRNQFAASTTDDNKLLTVTQLIQNICESFQGAKAAIVSTPVKKYVIKGVRPRRLRRKASGAEQLRQAGPTGKGKKATRNRNQRRRNAKKFKALKSHIRIHTESSALGALAESDAAAEKPMSTPDRPAPANEAEFDARRRALLEAITSGGVDIDENTPAAQGLSSLGQQDNAPSDQKDKLEASNKGQIAMEVDVPRGQKTQAIEGDPDEIVLNDANTTAAVASQPFKTESFSQPEKPRAKIDLASSRRLLFGALGLRTPKSKEEEKALQEKLMRDVKPLRQVRSNVDAIQDANAAAGEDDESWRDKIVLKAVECCHEGVELSTPPFPFVQRWDPQQQSGYNQKSSRRNSRKTKKRKRNQDQYYDGNEDQAVEEPAAKQAKLASAPITSATEETAPNEQEWYEQEWYDAHPTSSNAYQGAANEQLMREADEAAVNSQNDPVAEKDLPSLPKNITTCPTLTLEAARSGTVIAFKKLDMSKETNWQPRISDYRTALIDEALDDGTLCMTLALRDQPKNEAFAHEETGKRLYHKFEMPGFQEDNGHENAGRLELPFVELIEPKIIEAGESIDGDKATEVQENVDLPVIDTPTHHGSFVAPSLPTGKLVQPEETEHGVPPKSWENPEEVEVDKKTESVNPELIINDDGSPNIKYPDLGGRLHDLNSFVSQQVHSRTSSPIAATTTLSDTKAASPRPAEHTSATDVRQDILDLLEDAGWRSSIGVASEEPKLPQADQTEPKRSIEVHVRSSAPPSETNDTNGQLQEGQVESLPAEVPETLQVANDLGNSTPAQSTKSDRSNFQHSSEDEISLHGEVPLHDEEDDRLWEAQNGQRTTPRPTHNSMSPSRGAQPRSQPRSIESPAFSSISPPEVTKRKPNVRKNDIAAGRRESPPTSSTARTQARNSGPQPNTNGNKHLGMDGVNSDDDLPSLDQVFASQSSFRRRRSLSSQDAVFKAEESQSNLHDLPYHKPSQNSQKTQVSKETRSSSFNSPLPILSDDDDDPARGFVFSSQIPPGSQVVDLTLSSDPVEPPDSAYEGDSSLPNGPGWVRKLTRNQMEKKAGKAKHVELRKGGKVATVKR